MAQSELRTFRSEIAEEWTGKADHTLLGPGFDSFWPQYARGNQDLLVSDGHPYQLLGKGPGDIGGPFVVVRREYQDSSPRVHNRTGTDDDNIYTDNFLGRYFARYEVVNDLQFPPPLFTPPEEAIVQGTTAIANVIPTNPLSGALVALGELRSEGIPSLVGIDTWRSRTLRAREAGSEYLNVQFGWIPLVNDIRAFAHSVIESDEIQRRYEAESGKLLHRRFTFPTSITSEQSVDTDEYLVPGLKVGYWDAIGDLTTIVTKRYEMWFSGAFTYYLPPLGTRERDLAIANKLYGTRLTPEVVWNLTPWSWAADWVTNAGDVIHNISAFSQDGLVMPYAYLMSRNTHKAELAHNGAIMRRHGTPVSAWQTLTTTVKERTKATPFGFGLESSGFSDRQWSILTALGLSRGSRGMKYE